MSQLDSARACIQSTINHTYNLKSVILSMISCLGEQNDSEKLQEIGKKVEEAQREIELNIQRLSRYPIQRPLLTPKRIQFSSDDRHSKKKKKSSTAFESCFKYNLYLYNIDHNPSPISGDFKKSLEDLKLQVCRQKSIKGLENFEYHRDDKKSSYRIKAKFNFGIELLIFSDAGTVSKYLVSLNQESINLKQFMSLFEVRWEFELNSLDRNVCKCLSRIALWVDAHKGIYREKCKVCDLHLNFKNGAPMIPMIFFQGCYYHVTCYYDCSQLINN